MQSYENRSYKLSSSGSSKIAAALAKLCQQGELGESLFRRGITQASFCRFLASFAIAQHNKGKDINSITNGFLLLSGANASAASKALEGCTIEWEAVDEDGQSILDKNGNPTWELKKQSVSSYWEKAGDAPSLPNTSDLD